jgi:aspartate kinase
MKIKSVRAHACESKPLLVVKFGGDCMSGGSMDQTAKLIIDLRQKYRICAVVSARAEVTDQLVQRARAISAEPDRREFDALISTGEMEAAALLALKLISLKCKAKSLNAFQLHLRTDSAHGKARVLSIAPNMLKGIRQSDVVHVVTGFQGVTDGESLSTFGRGGSDTTAVCLTAALKASRCILFKKHLGIFDTDPSYDRDAKLISTLNASELVEMASLGMKAVQTRAAQFTLVNRIPLYISSLTKPNVETAIVHSHATASDAMPYKFVITTDKVLVELRGVKNKPGAFASIYSALIEDSIYVSAVSHSHFAKDKASLDILCGSEDIERIIRVADRLSRRRAIDAHTAYSDITVFSLIGAQMAGNAGVILRFLKTFSDQDVPVRMVNTSNTRITVVANDKITKERCQIICDQLRENNLLQR